MNNRNGLFTFISDKINVRCSVRGVYTVTLRVPKDQIEQLPMNVQGGGLLVLTTLNVVEQPKSIKDKARIRKQEVENEEKISEGQMKFISEGQMKFDDFMGEVPTSTTIITPRTPINEGSNTQNDESHPELPTMRLMTE